MAQKKKQQLSSSSLFRIGEPASPEHLIDRQEEVEALVSLLSNEKISYNVAVLGYRRIGKTSVLNKVQKLLEEEGNVKNSKKRKNPIVVSFDVKKNIGSPEILFTRLNTQIFNAYLSHISRSQRFKKKAGKFANQIIQKLTDTIANKKINGISFEASLTPEGTITVIPKIEFLSANGRRKDETPDYQKIMDTIFNTAKAFAEESDSRLIIMLDEFSDIVKLRHYRGLRNIIDQFRSILQERGDNVSYLICGSRVSMLREFLHSGNSSVFMHFKEYTIHELRHFDAVKLFEDYFRAREEESDILDAEEIRKLADDTFRLVGGHPFYIMALAEAWNPKKKENIEETYLRELTDPNGVLRLYQEYILSEDLGEATGGPVLRSILQFLASHRDPNNVVTPATGTEIANFLSRPLQQIKSYLEELSRYDLILKNDQDKTYAIRDKVLERYFMLEVDELDKKIVIA
jgi:AAA+ ATPase superfamily predicted ATPase